MDNYLSQKVYKMPKSEEEEKFYVGISNPTSLRRNLLEGSKNIIGSLQRYEKSKDIRKKKIEKIFELRKLIRSIKKLNSSLNSKLPYFPKVTKKRVKKKIEKESIEPELEKEIEKVKSSELKKLEDELKNIESELSKLGP